ncbi:hypothetical protein NQ317_003165 [Molorchus minor]|uniref:Uncharacterized protein n=1 Tax=Molorchus minor TaxID=1323400 RepID=A0ABQ9JZ21_9CUCU|nr:hypothetical protein NQ317_003165 [Molorchus minor]
MKRSFENSPNGQENYSEKIQKIALVERESNPFGVSLVNPDRVDKKTHVEIMELEESQQLMKNLQGLMNNVIQETRLNT